MADHWIDDALDTVARNMRAAGRQPVGYRKDGRAIWPMFGAEDPPAPQPTPSKVDGEFDFPEGKPLAEMTEPQRTEYWRHKARKHEDRGKQFGDLTPEKLAELRDKAKKQDDLEAELGTTADKAAAKARDEASTEVRGELEPQLITARLDAAAARAGVSEDDLKAALEFVDTKKFLGSDGKLDTDKVKAFVATIKPGKGDQQQQRKGPTATGHGSGNGNGNDGGGKPSSVAEVMAARRAARDKK